jgi:hypothetical protein
LEELGSLSQYSDSRQETLPNPFANEEGAASVSQGLLLGGGPGMGLSWLNVNTRMGSTDLEGTSC